jgi:hypothetical protein
MEIDPVTQLLAMQATKTQTLANIAIIKKNHEMEMALIEMLGDVARSAPAPAGQGRVVDKQA